MINIVTAPSRSLKTVEFQEFLQRIIVMCSAVESKAEYESEDTKAKQVVAPSPRCSQCQFKGKNRTGLNRHIKKNHNLTSCRSVVRALVCQLSGPASNPFSVIRYKLIY